eukprot:4013053-Amphidinium_carterae.1
MCKRVHFLPAAFRSFSRVEIASTSPEMTAWMGEFTAASHNPGLAPLSTSQVRTSASPHTRAQSFAVCIVHGQLYTESTVVHARTLPKSDSGAASSLSHGMRCAGWQSTSASSAADHSATESIAPSSAK